MTDHTSPENEENQCRFGIDSFAAARPNRVTDATVTGVERIQNLLEKIEAVDQVGVNVSGLGEHHPSEYLDSAPLSSSPPAAARTKKIRLTSVADPIRVFQWFATLDLISPHTPRP